MKPQPTTIVDSALFTGLVIQKFIHQIQVLAGDHTLMCALPPHLAAHVAAGDVVRCETAPTPDLPRLVTVLPRRSEYSRPAAASRPGAHAPQQVIAANVDWVMPVFAAASPTPKWNLLDRFLAAAEAQGLPARICITKCDLTSSGSPAELELHEILDLYRSLGYPVSLVSAQTGSGLGELCGHLSQGTTLLVGKSGVGKTTLLNALLPGADQSTRAVNAVTGKGRHTTTAAHLYPLPGGGAVMDTPGMREFGLWDITPEDMAACFPEMRPHLGRCRFGLSCQHDEEPGCAVRQAVMQGAVHPRRYQSYLRLKAEAA
ncbi:ribosome small subunit-dependent GTPase A [Levilinea saccharolytica]|uniref:ribosome small subunit-dependent GTPase A n=3 Tax=Levilinea saccharolytica TaxID=229921 RepID=UPI0009467492|nr:ribosome small subunit-dependent GTPase A [Levilinea saccharolytica]